MTVITEIWFIKPSKMFALPCTPGYTAPGIRSILAASTKRFNTRYSEWLSQTIQMINTLVTLEEGLIYVRFMIILHGSIQYIQSNVWVIYRYNDNGDRLPKYRFFIHEFIKLYLNIRDRRYFKKILAYACVVSFAVRKFAQHNFSSYVFGKIFTFFKDARWINLVASCQKRLEKARVHSNHHAHLYVPCSVCLHADPVNSQIGMRFCTLYARWSRLCTRANDSGLLRERNSQRNHVTKLLVIKVAAAHIRLKLK
jgi:hypothetical protein